MGGGDDEQERKWLPAMGDLSRRHMHRALTLTVEC